MKLTEKQKRFVDYYIKLGNATEAALKAGYSKKTARSIGQENLTKPDIKQRIDEQLAKIESARVADATEVMQYLTAVMRGEKSEETVVVEGSGDGMSEARIIEKHVSAREQVKAAELLAKRYGLLTDNVKLEGEATVKIVDDIKDEKE
jgi:phage terminase small subunit